MIDHEWEYHLTILWFLDFSYCFHLWRLGQEQIWFYAENVRIEHSYRSEEKPRIVSAEKTPCCFNATTTYILTFPSSIVPNQHVGLLVPNDFPAPQAACRTGLRALTVIQCRHEDQLSHPTNTLRIRNNIVDIGRACRVSRIGGRWGSCCMGSRTVSWRPCGCFLIGVCNYHVVGR